METSKFSISDYLDSNEMIAEYLNTVLEAGEKSGMISNFDRERVLSNLHGKSIR